MYHLGIRPSSNPPLKKTLSLYEGVGLIPGIFKIYVCRSLDQNFYHISKKKKKLEIISKEGGTMSYITRSFFYQLLREIKEEWGSIQQGGEAKELLLVQQRGLRSGQSCHLMHSAILKRFLKTQLQADRWRKMCLCKNITISLAKCMVWEQLLPRAQPAHWTEGSSQFNHICMISSIFRILQYKKCH